jgi:hypothetical protein
MNMDSFEIWSLANNEDLNIDRDMDMDRMKKRNATHAPDSDQNAIGNTM